MIDESFLPNWYPLDAKAWMEKIRQNPNADSIFEPVAIATPYVLMRKRVIASKQGERP
jgi:hypothetical protein